MQTIIFSGGSRDFNKKSAHDYLSIIFRDFESSPDYLYISKEEGKSKIGISEIKKAIGFISIKPSYSKLKAVFIEDANYLSLDAQNAMLKTLEEPPEYAFFIMTVDHPSNLLSTVLSRSKIQIVNDPNISSQNFKELVESYISICDSPIENRIDWLTENKKELGSKETVVLLIDDIMNFYHKEFSVNLSSSKSQLYSKRVKFLIATKERILKFNANPLLCIETFLATI